MGVSGLRRWPRGYWAGDVAGERGIVRAHSRRGPRRFGGRHAVSGTPTSSGGRLSGAVDDAGSHARRGRGAPGTRLDRHGRPLQVRGGRSHRRAGTRSWSSFAIRARPGGGSGRAAVLRHLHVRDGQIVSGREVRDREKSPRSRRALGSRRCRRRTWSSCATSKSGCSIEPRGAPGARGPRRCTSILPTRSDRVVRYGLVAVAQAMRRFAEVVGENPPTSSGSCSDSGTLSWPPSVGHPQPGKRGIGRRRSHTPGPARGQDRWVRVGAGSRRPSKPPGCGVGDERRIEPPRREGRRLPAALRAGASLTVESSMRRCSRPQLSGIRLGSGRRRSWRRSRTGRSCGLSATTRRRQVPRDHRCASRWGGRAGSAGSLCRIRTIRRRPPHVQAGIVSVRLGTLLHVVFPQDWQMSSATADIPSVYRSTFQIVGVQLCCILSGGQ